MFLPPLEWPFYAGNVVVAYDNTNPFCDFHEDYKQGDAALSYEDRMAVISHDCLIAFNQLN